MTTASAAHAMVHQWAADVVGDDHVTSELRDEPSAGIHVQPLALAMAPESRGTTRSPVRYRIRYLVAAAPTAEGVDLLDRLLVAAQDVTELHVDLAPLGPELWTALGATPRPAFILEADVRHEPDEPTAPPVREPLVLQGGITQPLRGRLVGPGGIGIGGARIELVDSGASTRTSVDGSFRFAAVPVQPEHKRFTIEAKGGRYTASVDVAGPDDDVLIHCNPLEA